MTRQNDSNKKTQGLLGLAISLSTLVGACSTTNVTHRTAEFAAPISYKASVPNGASSQMASIGQVRMPYASQSAPSYTPPSYTPPSYTPPVTAPAKPSFQAAQSFDQAGVDTDLYMHQKVGRPYTIKGERYTPEHNPSYDTTGQASWYGPSFHGKLTANGEVYDKNGLTAAHKTLPLNSMVFVTNLENGKTTMLRLNDRGPFVDGRIIDLSEGAAKVLGVSGLANVRVQYAGPADPSNNKKVATQAELAAPVMPRPMTQVPEYVAPAPVQQAPQTAPQVAPQVAEAPVYKPLSVIPFDLSGPTSAPNSATDSYKAPVAAPVAPAAPITPAPVFVAPQAPEMTRTAPLMLPQAEAQRGRQDFMPPSDGGVMTLTITGPIHMASADAQTAGQVIPAVHEGSDAPLKSALGVHYVQAAAFSSQARANSVKTTLSAAGDVSIQDVTLNGQTLHRVLVGPFNGQTEAQNAQNLVATLGYSDARIVEMH